MEGIADNLIKIEVINAMIEYKIENMEAEVGTDDTDDE